MAHINWSNLQELNNFNISNIPDNLCGVYRISYKEPNDGKFYVFYVGKSENIKNRMLAHLSDNESNLCIKKRLSNYLCAFKYAEVNSQILDGVEAYLIESYKPACNENIPNTIKEEVNIN